MRAQQIPAAAVDRSLLSQMCLGLIAGATGFVLNWFRIEFYFNVDFILGSVAAMYALMRFGLVAGVIAAFVASICTWHLWHHPWAVLIFTAEALFTGLACKSKDRDPVIPNLAYWFTLGICLVLVFYKGVMGFPLQSALVIALKQGINGISNTLLASALHIAIVVSLRKKEELPSLRQLIFVTVSLLVTLPALFFLYIDIRHIMRRQLSEYQKDTVRIAYAAQAGIDTWLADRAGVIQFLAASDWETAGEVQRHFDTMRQSRPEFQRLGLVGTDGFTVAFSPRLDENSKSTLGLDLSDRAYLRKVSSPPYLGVLELVSGRIGRPGPRLIMASSILSGGAYRGAVFGVAELNSLDMLLQRFVLSSTGSVTLVDGSGLVVISTKPGLKPLQRYALRDFVARDEPEGIKHLIPPPQSGVSPYKRWLASVYIRELPLQGYPGWKLVVENPLRPPLDSISQKATMALGGTGTLLVPILLCACYFAGRVATVVSEFERVTRKLPEQIAAGTIIEWPRAATCELSGLTDNLRVMTWELKQSHDALRQLNCHLEEHVEERTAQLQEREEALRQSQQLLLAVIESTSDQISVKDRGGRYLLLNMAGLNFIGKDVIGKNDYSLYPRNEADHITGHDRLVFEQGRVLSFETVKTNSRGEERVFDVVKGPIRDALGDITGVFAVSRDITELHEAQQELRRRLALQERLEIITNTAPGVIFEYRHRPDGSGSFPYVSQSVRDIWGFGPEEVKEDGSAALALIHPVDRPGFVHTMTSPRRPGVPLSAETRLVPAGRELWVKVSAVMTPEHDGGCTWFGFITDISPYKEAERVLRQSEDTLKRAVAERTVDLRRLAERIEKVSEHERAMLAQEIHDELGQLLAALMMDLAWFKKRLPDGDEQWGEKLRAMDTLLGTTIQCARRITRDLRPRMLDELGLVSAIEEQMDLFRQRQIDCRLEVPNRAASVDQERSNSLFRIFQESMTNVMRHSRATRAHILLDITAERIILEVKDNGCGITVQQCNTLESLGLLGIRERAMRWGGRVEIGGAPGGGTVVHVEMPQERRRKQR